MKFKIILFSTIAISCASHSVLTIQSSTQDFDAFWQSLETKTAAERFNHFKLTVYKSFPEFYDYKFDQWTKNGHDPIQSFNQELDEYPIYRNDFLAIGKKLPVYLEKSAISFKKIFPEFNENIKVHIINSFGELDGGTRILDNNLHLIFGAESIAKYHKSKEMEGKVAFLHHEFFHMYHRQFFRVEDKIYSSLWAEGLAVLAAKALNPKATLAQLSLDNPKDLMKVCELLMPRLIKDLTGKLESSSPEDFTSYFFNSSKHEWIPKRAGYCIGYKIAKVVSKRNSIESLAKLHGDEILPIIKSGLNELAMQTEPGKP